MEALVRIEDKVQEAAEAAADAAAHAVEAAKAAEAAQVARATKKARPARTTKAAMAAKAGKAASKAAGPDASLLMEPTGPLQTPSHVLDVRLTDDELAQIERLAAKQELPVPDLARSLLVRALNRSGEA